MTSCLHSFLIFIVLLGGGGAQFDRPEIVPDKEELILETGQPLKLDCRSSQGVAWCSDTKIPEENYEEYLEEGGYHVSRLTIDAVNTSHVGYYSCIFNTTENIISKECDISDPFISSLYLYVKDVNQLLVKKITYVSADISQPVYIPCKPTFPDVNVTLTKTDSINEAKYDPRNGFLITQVTVKKNEGHYLCHATYQNKTEERILILDVTAQSKPHQPSVAVEGAWQEDTRPDVVVYYVREDSNVNLTCTYNSDMNVKLIWDEHHSNKTTGKHRIIRHGKTRYYELNHVTLQDSGIYLCKAKYYSDFSEPSKLNISVVANDATYLSTFIFDPNVTDAAVNVHWEILFIAHPMPVFRWYKGDELLGDSSREWTQDQHQHYEMDVRMEEAALSLYLYNWQLNDNAKYTLEASLPGTNITTITTMFLMIPCEPQNVQIIGSSDIEVFMEGENFTFMCTAEGFPKPDLKLHFIPYQNIANLKRKDDYVYNQLRKVEYIGEEDETNTVKRTMHWMGNAEYPGWYQCTAVNIIENKYVFRNTSKKLLLVTDGASRLTLSLSLEIGDEKENPVGKDVTVVEGDDFKLTCRANKVATIPPLTWTLNDSPLDKTTRKVWNMEVTENETRLSLLSTIHAKALQRVADKLSISCMDKAVNYTFLNIRIQEMVSPAWRGKSPDKNYEKNKNENLTLSCPATGNPRPIITWRKEKQILKENNRVKIGDDYQLLFDFLLGTDHGQYTCEIENRAGRITASFNVTVRDSDYQTIVITLAVVGVLIAALMVLSVFFCRKIYQARKETLNLQLREQKMFMEGDPSSLNPDIPLEEQAELLPYNTKYEVSRDSIIFDKLLGAGAFGRVYSATVLNLVPGEARTTVAVKMIKSRTDSSQLKALRSEVKILIHIGRHANIVNLLGACSKDYASKGELLLLVEYCKHGNILDYMRRHRREFVNQINEDDKIDPSLYEPRPRHRSDSSSRSHTSHGLKYAHLHFHQDNVFYSPEQTSNIPNSTSSNFCVTRNDPGYNFFRARTLSASSANRQLHSDNSLLPSETSAGTSDGYLSSQVLNGTQTQLRSIDLLEWAYQIAKGMEYLAFKKVLHGDLAARNVLLADHNVVKISDFGLAKDIYKNDNYKIGSSRPVPVKWMAVECLRDGVFSTQSDVWSYGVVLWEIFSLGQIPYSCSDFDEAFILNLEKGVRLEQPRYATYSLYHMMLECWQADPLDRPSFTYLEASLEEMRGEAQRQNYLQLTESYQQEGSTSEFMEMFPSQDYSAKVRLNTPPRDEEGYEMPFSPGVSPELMIQGSRISDASRLTTRQMKYFTSAETENSQNSYVPMSADLVNRNTVFDFDNETVTYIKGLSENPESGDHDIYLKMNAKQDSSKPDTPDSVFVRDEDSPQRDIINNVSSQGSRRSPHLEVKKHDSGVYSPTRLMQTNPEYMPMSRLLSTEECNYVNTEATESNNRMYANFDYSNQSKAKAYLVDSNYRAEYANLLSKDADPNHNESKNYSGVVSIVEEKLSATRTDKHETPPILQESMIV